MYTHAVVIITPHKHQIPQECKRTVINKLMNRVSAVCILLIILQCHSCKCTCCTAKLASTNSTIVFCFFSFHTKLKKKQESVAMFQDLMLEVTD